jgi:hypothetical protein
LKLTSGLNEVNFPRKMRPRERSEQSWSIFQRWKFIWVKRGATERNRLSPVMLSDRREDEILVQRCPNGKNLELRVRRKFFATVVFS